MKLRDLQYLVAIDEERHFHKAAQRCFVSQPTLSGQVKKLEQELGVLLIERNTRQVIMTDVGRAVAQQARQVLLAAQQVKEIASSYHDPMAGDLQIGMIPTVSAYLLPLIMPALNQHFPRLHLWLQEHQTAELLEKIKTAELDLAILALPVSSQEFKELFLYKEGFRLAVSHKHDLANCSAVRLADLNRRNMLLLEEGHCLRGQALDICYRSGAVGNAGFHATSLEILKHMVGENMGMTLMPELAVPVRRISKAPVRYLPFTDPVPNRRIAMLYRKTSYRQSAFKHISKLIRATLSKLNNRFVRV